MTRRRSSPRLPQCGYTHPFRGSTCTERGDHFCVPRADRAQDFFEKVCVHTKSIYARQAFVLDDWQRDDIIRPLFGTVRWSGQWRCYVRRYTVAWIELGRGNGKSELDAGVVLLLMVGDDEESSEVYGAAKDTKQAGKVGEVVKRMAQLSPLLGIGSRGRLFYNRQSRRLSDPKTNSYYEIITSDAAGELGHNPYGSVIDEVLTQADAGLWNALRTAQGKRPWSLLFGTTTAGNEPSGFAAKTHDEMMKVMEDPARAPHTFVYIRGLPKNDEELERLYRIFPGHPDLPVSCDPWDERNWKWPNPALDVFLSRDTLREEAMEARNDPTKENAFRQFRMGQWVQQSTRWLSLRYWDAQPNIQLVVEEQLKGRECYGGLDLSSKLDVTALVWDFPGEDGAHDTLHRFWLPEDRLKDLDRRTGGQASVWAREGFLRLTPGDVVDYSAVEKQLDDDAKRFDVREVGFDPWSATQLVQRLDGLPWVEVRQGYRSMSEPMKEWQKLVVEGKERHGGHPVMRWMVDNLVVRMDPNGNIAPDKQRSHEKIDGPVARIMALSAAMQSEPAAESGAIFA